jgi:hypothetical protein
VRLPVPRRTREQVIQAGWGFYFATWALALFSLLVIGGARFLGTLAGSFGLSASTATLASVLVVLVAGGVTLRHFRAVWQQTHFPLWKVGRAFIASFLLLLLSLAVGAIFQPPAGWAVTSGALAIVAGILAYQLRWSLGRVPAFGWTAVCSLGLSAVASGAAIALTGSILLYGGLWMVTVVVWGACAITCYLPEETITTSGSSGAS